MCINCDGRAWQDSAAQSLCYNCNEYGTPVPSGQEIEISQFKCDNCNGRAWYGRAQQSKCRNCDEYGVPVPDGEEIEVSQFKCNNCDGRAWYERAERSLCKICNMQGAEVPEGEEWRQFKCDHCNERGWIAMAERSKCRFCNRYGTLIPTGQEVGVFVCKFMCTCDRCNCTSRMDPDAPYEYTVVCEMTDTAKCYSCRDRGHNHRNSPYGFTPRRRINRKSNNVHECSKCYGCGDCPNLRQAQEYICVAMRHMRSQLV